MTREHEGNFAQKHGPDARLDPAVKEKIEKKIKNGQLGCAAAFQIAEELGISPAEIGKALDLMEIKLMKCQLGLFGYEPGKKKVEPKKPESPGLAGAIEAALADGKLSCHDAWDLARRFNVGKMTVSAACEALNIKIKACQLGAF